MISKGEEVKGQGVGSAYFELIKLIELKLSDKIKLTYNNAKEADFNHIHTIHPKCFWQMKTSKKPSCMHVHFLPETVEGSIKLPKIVQSFFYHYFIHFYKTAEELIVVNPIFIEPLKQYGIDKERITYIPNVVATKDFYPKQINEPSELFKKHHLSLDKFTVISVGQVQTRKGVLDFIEIAKQLPEVQFIWAGGFSFGKITDGYDQLTAVIKNPPSNVKFVGIVDREQMNELYNACDLLLTTSYNELFPVSILEAVNSGLPILVRDLDLYEKIYFTDYLRANNNEAFVDYIKELMTSPETMAKAKASSNKIATDYSEENVAQLWDDYYTRFYQRWVK
ncbi:hypothetical protein HMPREF2811_04380 [Globicatella sp. HMSC072A10]|nr:hypothetical protein HMPREF2811_04380 [Globicatella sp. HMSC072A10]